MQLIPPEGENIPTRQTRTIVAVLLWIAVSMGWLVSVFAVVEELCLAAACRDSASFTFFGVHMGWLGIAYFSLILLMLRFRNVPHLLARVPAAMLFAGAGAELRLLWIQKYVIGSWCPLCVTICCSLFAATMALLIENIQAARQIQGGGKKGVSVWLLFAVAMFITGLVIAIVGVRALT